VLQFNIALYQPIEERLHVGLIRGRLKRAWLTLDRHDGNGQRLLHQMQISVPEFSHDLITPWNWQQSLTSKATIAGYRQ